MDFYHPLQKGVVLHADATVGPVVDGQVLVTLEQKINGKVQEYRETLVSLEDQAVREALQKLGCILPGTPIDMVLHCPACHEQHIDEPEDEIDRQCNTNRVHGLLWTNPPHRSHLCHSCGFIWRPSDVCTNGVAQVMTAGKNDSPITE